MEWGSRGAILPLGTLRGGRGGPVQAETGETAFALEAEACGTAYKSLHFSFSAGLAPFENSVVFLHN